ncbi:MAG TPA: twin-arginine translocase TatA/TatE family subunit [Anaeromyxobacteraceae bacterium]|nr:twin-arginine translocase TatA/TatE family subunit [Anaeromyxobacteraceae bacterium]
MGLRPSEVLVILVVVVLVFGANKIPQLGDALGRGIRNFRKATREDDAIDVTPKKVESGQVAGSASKGAPPEEDA